LAAIEDLERALIAADKAGNAEDAKRLAGAIVTMRSSQHTPVNPTDEMGSGQRALAGVGMGMHDLWTGGKQRLGLVSPEEVAAQREVDKPLMDTPEGFGGALAGNAAVALPIAMTLPASIPGAAATGGALGMLQPTAPGESAVKNTAVNAALGGAGQYGLGKLASFAGNRLAAAEQKGAAQAAQNVARDDTLKQVQAAGYKIPPSLSGGSKVERMAEGLSGKVKTQQAMAVEDQNLTNNLIRKQLELPPNAPLVRETLSAKRAEVYQQGYTPVESLPSVNWDHQFVRDMADMVPARAGGAVKSPGHAEIEQLADSLSNRGQWTGPQLVQDIRQLRENSSGRYLSTSAAERDLAKAEKKAADALEGLAERNITSQGGDPAIVQQYRDARQYIAMSHQAEKALIEGGGNFNAKVIGAALQKKKPLTGNMRTVGLFANNFGDVAGVPKAGWSNPITALDAFGAAGMAGMGAGPASIALPAARMGARQFLLNHNSKPHYGPGLLTRGAAPTLEELRKLGLGGLLGPSAYAAQ
jgi:hypothetical protein